MPAFRQLNLELFVDRHDLRSEGRLHKESISVNFYRPPKRSPLLKSGTCTTEPQFLTCATNWGCSQRRFTPSRNNFSITPTWPLKNLGESQEKMEESDVEVIRQKAREKYPEAKPRIITDNGPQFISPDFKEFVRIAGMTNVKTSPNFSYRGIIDATRE